MKSIYVCNTLSDYISSINIQTLKENKIYIRDRNVKKGPYGICLWCDKLLVANSFSNTLSKVNTLNERVEEDYYIGSRLTDVKVYDNIAYITCGENDNIILFDLIKNKIIYQISCGINPTNIGIFENLSLGLITNMMGNSVSILDLKMNEVVKEINVGEYPTKSYIYKSDYFICCESNLGEDKTGKIVIRSINKGEAIKEITVGKSPVDFYYDNNLDMIFVSNFGEGSISFIDLSNFEEFKKIYIGGMPRGILKKGRFLYVGDNFNDSLIIVDIFTNNKKVIPIGKDPNGMTF